MDIDRDYKDFGKLQQSASSIRIDVRRPFPYGDQHRSTMPVARIARCSGEFQVLPDQQRSSERLSSRQNDETRWVGLQEFADKPYRKIAGFWIFRFSGALPV